MLVELLDFKAHPGGVGGLTPLLGLKFHNEKAADFSRNFGFFDDKLGTQFLPNQISECATGWSVEMDGRNNDFGAAILTSVRLSFITLLKKSL